MGTKSTVRRRRTPEEARAEILDAAEAVLLKSGPADLKFQKIAAEAGLSQSNIHHHFGGVLEIKKALVDRMFMHLTAELAEALLASREEDREARITNALNAIYAIISKRRFGRLMGWIALSSQPDQVVYFLDSYKAIERLIVTELQHVMSEERARKHAKAIVFQVAVTAVGDGLIREYLEPALGADANEIDASKVLLDMVLEE